MFGPGLVFGNGVVVGLLVVVVLPSRPHDRAQCEWPGVVVAGGALLRRAPFYVCWPLAALLQIGECCRQGGGAAVSHQQAGPVLSAVCVRVRATEFG